jgi:hypothetical protein
MSCLVAKGRVMCQKAIRDRYGRRRLSWGRSPSYNLDVRPLASLFRLVLAERAVWPVVVIGGPAGADQIHLLVPATRLGADQAVQLVEILDLGSAGNRAGRPSGRGRFPARRTGQSAKPTA